MLDPSITGSESILQGTNGLPFPHRITYSYVDACAESLIYFYAQHALLHCKLCQLGYTSSVLAAIHHYITPNTQNLLSLYMITYLHLGVLTLHFVSHFYFDQGSDFAITVWFHIAYKNIHIQGVSVS